MIEVIRFEQEGEDNVTLELTDWGENHVEFAIYDEDGTQKFFQMKNKEDILNAVNYLMKAIS